MYPSAAHQHRHAGGWLTRLNSTISPRVGILEEARRLRLLQYPAADLPSQPPEAGKGKSEGERATKMDRTQKAMPDSSSTSPRADSLVCDSVALTETIRRSNQIESPDTTRHYQQEYE
ncbi:hypothetical protein N7532_007569 [Penicillium argentinense]|uniref:Uncharacterized protein n=1 Tax=Penicillium argentinense TaxID=1131581 RepID=A0A9W9K6S9_9EURO|nr:uncharacterized protein N7532_007569 [Penicillium argentinense]KAJ5095278.1 hypothetical protein N7532_007569 [Penicillium argentinense]